MSELVHSAFQAAVYVLGGSPGGSAAAGAWEFIKASYGAPWKVYHSIQHLHRCIERCPPPYGSDQDTCADLSDIERARLALTLTFHDVVYAARSKDNEEHSAWVAYDALKLLGVDEAHREAIRAAVLATDYREGARYQDGPVARWARDIDLSFLADPWGQFQLASADVRAEYVHVADEDYQIGRHTILGRVLAWPRIYRTDVMYGRYEHVARANIERALGGGGRSP